MKEYGNRFYSIKQMDAETEEDGTSLIVRYISG
jgi:hypothetical protein